MKTLAIVAGVALVAVVGNIVLLMRRPAAVPPAPKKEVEEAPVARRPLPPTVDVRAQIRQAIAVEQPKLHSPRDVDSYLDDLKLRARRNHQVTALEVEPGIAAIQAQYDPAHANERIQQFASEMEKLSAELDGRDHAPPPPDIDVVARNLEQTVDENRRQDLIREYLQAANSLPPEDQQRRMAWLDAHAGTNR